MANAITETLTHAVSLTGSPHLTMTERGLSVALGLGIAAAGIKPRPNPLLNVLALGVGSYLAYRGATGYCPVRAAIGHEA